jgi:hypothetical protein
MNDAVLAIEQLSPEALQELWTNDHSHICNLVRWLEERANLLRGTLKRRVRALQIWPSGGELHSLDQLVVPGSFVDELRLASIVDLKALNIDSKFPLDLGAQELTIATYSREQVKLAFDLKREIDDEGRRRLVSLLAEKFSELGDDQEARKSLSGCPLVECTDGEFRLAGEVYFEKTEVYELLGAMAHLAAVPTKPREAAHNFLRWLGVQEKPRIEDLISRIRTLCHQPPQVSNRREVQKIFAHLAKRFDADGNENDDALSALADLAWLPAEGDTTDWYRPDTLYSIYEKHLFFTQAKFLDINHQEKCAGFLRRLKIKSTPTSAQMVSHLLEMAHANRPVNKEVYNRLNRQASDLNILRLKGERCLLLDSQGYVSPEEVFWEEHGLGRYRFRLSTDMKGYGELLDQIGVKERPEMDDAIRVLQEISGQFSTSGSPLDEETRAVLLQCWKLLSNASGLELNELRELKVIPDNRNILEPPKHVFFNDRPGLAERFQNYLRNNVIERPQDAWRGMHTVGVRNLSEAVTTRLVDRENPNEDHWLFDRISERQGMIARVVEAHRHEGDSSWDLSTLREMRVESVSNVLLSHSIRISNRMIDSRAISVSAYYDPNDKILYLQKGDDYPWGAIARELAYALNAQAEAGKVAPGLKEVLIAHSINEVSDTLDELGYASLNTTAAADLTGTGTVTLTGTETDEESVMTAFYSDSELWENDSTEIGVNPPAGAGALNTSVGRSGESIEAPKGVSSNVGEKHVQGPHGSTHTKSSLIIESNPALRGGKVGTATGPAQRFTRSRLLSYVVPPGTTNEEPIDTAAAERRTQIDEAGIARVKEFEAQSNREAEVMPHHNEGFDIKSYDENGKLSRYIEVKSLSGDWDVDNVKLTHRQFDHAMEIGERYWLYVVENAERDDYSIMRIRNPARQVTYFVYDCGWEGVREEDATPRDPILD